MRENFPKEAIFLGSIVFFGLILINIGSAAIAKYRQINELELRVSRLEQLVQSPD